MLAMHYGFLCDARATVDMQAKMLLGQAVSLMQVPHLWRTHTGGTEHTRAHTVGWGWGGGGLRNPNGYYGKRVAVVSILDTDIIYQSVNVRDLFFQY